MTLTRRPSGPQLQRSHLHAPRRRPSPVETSRHQTGVVRGPAENIDHHLATAATGAPRELQEYVRGILTQHGHRMTNAGAVAKRFADGAHVLATKGKESALLGFHLEMRVFEILAARSDITRLDLQSHVGNQEIDVYLEIEGNIYLLETKLNDYSTGQHRRLRGTAQKIGAKLIYVQGFLPPPHSNRSTRFSARHLEAIAALPTDEFIRHLDRVAVPTSAVLATKPTNLISGQQSSPVLPMQETRSATPHAKNHSGESDKTRAIAAYRRARELIRDRDLRDNMAMVDTWLSPLTNQQRILIWETIAQKTELAEQRLAAINNRDRAAWLSSRPQDLEQRLSMLFADPDYKSFLSRLCYELTPDANTFYTAPLLNPGHQNPILGNVAFKKNLGANELIHESELYSHGTSAAYLYSGKVGIKVILEQRLAASFADDTHAASVNYAFLMWHVLRILKIPVVDLYEHKLVSPSQSFFLGTDIVSRNVEYDAISMQHLAKVDYCFDIDELAIPLKQLAKANRDRIEQILEVNGLDCDAIGNCLAFDRKTGQVILFDTANIYVANPTLFREKFLFTLPATASKVTPSFAIPDDELYAIYGGD